MPTGRDDLARREGKGSLWNLIKYEIKIHSFLFPLLTRLGTNAWQKHEPQDSDAIDPDTSKRNVGVSVRATHLLRIRCDQNRKSAAAFSSSSSNKICSKICKTNEKSIISYSNATGCVLENKRNEDVSLKINETNANAWCTYTGATTLNERNQGTFHSRSDLIKIEFNVHISHILDILENCRRHPLLFVSCKLLYCYSLVLYLESMLELYESVRLNASALLA